MCGKGVIFGENQEHYFISEGFRLDGKINGLGRIFKCSKGSQELRLYFGNLQESIPNGICRVNAVGIYSYTGYVKNGQWYGIGRENTPDGGSYFG